MFNISNFVLSFILIVTELENLGVISVFHEHLTICIDEKTEAQRECGKEPQTLWMQSLDQEPTDESMDLYIPIYSDAGMP